MKNIFKSPSACLTLVAVACGHFAPTMNGTFIVKYMHEQFRTPLSSTTFIAGECGLDKRFKYYIVFSSYYALIPHICTYLYFDSRSNVFRVYVGSITCIPALLGIPFGGFLLSRLEWDTKQISRNVVLITAIASFTLPIGKHIYKYLQNPVF